jgi:hypothetical protein
MPVRFQKTFLIVLFIAGWFALVAQFYLIILNKVAPVSETIIRYFSFFTVLTNLIVVVCCTFLLLKPTSHAANFFSQPVTLTAIAVYISVVAIVYNSILRFLWKPEGLQLVVDELLHPVIPVLFVIMWLLFIRNGALKWRDIYVWLIYPLVYIVYILIRGALSGFYPYPFINVTELGYNTVLINSVGLLLVFLFFSLLFVAIEKLRSKNKSVKLE